MGNMKQKKKGKKEKRSGQEKRKKGKKKKTHFTEMGQKLSSINFFLVSSFFHIWCKSLK